MLLLFALFVSRVKILILLAATSYFNVTTPTTSEAHATPICCFVVQDTVSEEWWQETSYSSAYDVVNVTSITTLITAYPNVTYTNYETHVYTTNHSFLFSYLVGINPITNFINDAPGPTEVEHSLNGTAIVTAGVTVYVPPLLWMMGARF